MTVRIGPGTPIRRSSKVERPAVNGRVVGSSPTVGAYGADAEGAEAPACRAGQRECESPQRRQFLGQVLPAALSVRGGAVGVRAPGPRPICGRSVPGSTPGFQPGGVGSTPIARSFGELGERINPAVSKTAGLLWRSLRSNRRLAADLPPWRNEDAPRSGRGALRSMGVQVPPAAPISAEWRNGRRTRLKNAPLRVRLPPRLTIQSPAGSLDERRSHKAEDKVRFLGRAPWRRSQAVKAPVS